MFKTFAYFLAGALVATLGDSPAPQPMPIVSTKTYFVTSSRAFPKSLPLSSKSLLFLNGLFQTAGVDYDVSAGSTFRFRPGVLSDGDHIAVVTLP